MTRGRPGKTYFQGTLSCGVLCHVPLTWGHILCFDFIECFTTTFLHTHSWLNWVDEDDNEVGLKENPEDTRYIKKITLK